jgi:hypothetical protein
MAAPVTGEPFSAIWTNEIVRTLSDDAHITKHEHHFCDTGFGRTRTRKMHLLAAKAGKPEQKLVVVIDPVAV